MPDGRRHVPPARDLNTGKINTTDAKRIFLEHLADGEPVAAAARAVDRTARGYEHWRNTDEAFRHEADIVIRRRLNTEPEQCPDFPEFCERFLHQPLFAHQLRMWDVIQGLPPRDLREGMRYSAGNPQRIILNVPPEMGKTTTWSINYVVWRLCQDSNHRVVLVSATEAMAKKFLHGVKQRLTHPTYAEMHRRFGPPGGFKKSAHTWTTTMMYLGGGDGIEKDPNVQAIGIGGQIYGARADELIVDDGVVLSNVQHWEKQVDWITQEVITRLSGGKVSKLIVLGTRVAPVDLYQKLRDEFLDGDGNSVWTYFSQPAVFSYGDTPAEWDTLWPEAFDIDGVTLVPKWDGPALKTRRDEVKATTWNLVYQQLNVLLDSVFPEVLVKGAVQAMRKPGPLMPGVEHWNRPGGMNGLYVVAGLDPATSGYTAATVLGVDRRARKMWLLDQYNRKGILPRELRRLVKDWTVRYGVNEWRIETNAFQQSIIQDDDLKMYLHERGVILKGHRTGSQKWEPSFGVASMSTLFELQPDGLPMIFLPCDNSQFPAVAALVDQMLTWQPGVKWQTQDCLMSLPLETPLWTDDGWTTMGNVRVGQRVVTDQGDWTEIVGKSPVTRRDVFRVTFRDGSVLDASDDHRWLISPVAPGGRTLLDQWMTTLEIRDALEGRTFARIRVHKPKGWQGSDVSLPIDPYVLGVWLGNGTAHNGVVSSAPEDAKHIRLEFEAAGVPTTDRSVPDRFGTIGLHSRLIAAGLTDHKMVPEAYFTGSRQQRLDLLQGLLDTDGAAEANYRVSFSNSNRNLVDAVEFLARSLGYRTNLSHHPAGWGAVPGGTAWIQEHWRVIFHPGPSGPNPFRLPRKADIVASWGGSPARRCTISVSSVEYVTTCDVVCIAVADPRHVFLAGRDLVPTGNSLWFTVIRAREVMRLTPMKQVDYVPSAFLSRRRARNEQVVVDIEALSQERYAEGML